MKLWEMSPLMKTSACREDPIEKKTVRMNYHIPLVKVFKEY